MLRRILHSVMLGEIGLQYDFAGSFPPPGTPRNLGQELKRTLGGAEIRQAECHVRADYADKSHPMDIVAFGDHLGSDKQVEFACIQCAQHTLEIRVAANCVAIQSRDPRLWEKSMQQLFELL